MPIISVRDRDHDRGNKMQTRKQKKNNNAQNKDRKEQVGAEALVKGWEVNGFVLH